MSVFVAMSAALATIFSLEKSRKWIIREGRNGISASGAGAPMASGLRKSRGLRMVGDDIDSPVNVWRCYPLRHAPSRCSLRSSSRSQPPRRPRPTGSAWPRRPSSTSRSPRCATPCPTGRGPRCASPLAGPDRPGLRRGRAPAPSAAARASSPSWPWSTAARADRRRPIWPRSCSATRPSRAMRAPDGHRSRSNVLARTPGQRAGGLRPRAAGGRATCASPCAPARRRRASARARPSPRRWPPPAGGPVDAGLPRGRRAAGAVRAPSPLPRARARRARRPRARRPRIVCPAAPHRRSAPTGGVIDCPAQPDQGSEPQRCPTPRLRRWRPTRPPARPAAPIRTAATSRSSRSAPSTSTGPPRR